MFRALLSAELSAELSARGERDAAAPDRPGDKGAFRVNPNVHSWLQALRATHGLIGRDMLPAAPPGADLLTAVPLAVPAPVLTSVTPTQGPATGGTQLTLTGSNLAGATVTVGGRAATNLFYNAAGTQILATTPPGTAGPATVTVTTPGGTSSRTGFTYVAVPTLTSVSPVKGPTAGGTRLTLTGTNLANPVRVTVNGAPATILSSTGTQITVTAPAGTAGPATVVVTTAGGTSNTATYTYLAAPVVTSLSPTQGPRGGGTRLTLTGTNLANATQVTVNGVPAAILGNTGTQITATAPAGTAGPATVVVTTAGGTSNPTTYTYLAAPTLGSVAPNRGTTAGGTQITITGTNLAGATVSIDGRAATSVYANAAGTQLIATTPPGSSGATNVTVTTPAGSATLANGFTYLPPAPVISSIAPVQGPTAGGQIVTLTGAGFTGATGVTFNGTAATIVSGTGTQLVVRTPTGTAGPATVLVTTAGGTSNAVAYTYLPAPTLTSVSPNSGTTSGGRQIVLTGTNLAGATVTIGGRAATNLFYNAAGTQILATTPPGTAGPATVTVTTPGGSGSLPGGFTYVPSRGVPS